MPFKHYTSNTATFVVLRHLVTIRVSELTNPNNLTNDILISNSLTRIFTESKQLCSLFEEILVSPRTKLVQG